jgi:hypothetical protein
VGGFVRLGDGQRVPGSGADTTLRPLARAGAGGLVFSCGHLQTAIAFEWFDVGVGHAEW